MWRCGHGFDDSTRTLLKVDLHTGEILINHLDEFWSESEYVASQTPASKVPGRPPTWR